MSDKNRTDYKKYIWRRNTLYTYKACFNSKRKHSGKQNESLSVWAVNRLLEDFVSLSVKASD